MKELEKANLRLSRVKILKRGESLFLQGTFPPKKGEGDKPKQYQFSLKCKANSEGLKIAVAKAQEIESALILEKWQWQEENKEKLTVEKAIQEFTKHYWNIHEKTRQSEHYYTINQEKHYTYLPEDRIFNKELIIEAIQSFPVNSYVRHKFITYIRPLAKYHGITLDYSQFGKYKQKTKTLPLLEDIIEAYKNCSERYNQHHKWLIGILFTFGLRPHEVFRSEFVFDRGLDPKTGENLPNIVLVPENTKTGIRTVYPLRHPDINVFDLEIPKFEVDLTLPNTSLGAYIGKRFVKYPFTAYQLRHYYAVRGAMEGISPVTMSKWMGHSLTEHFKSYASLLGDIESETIWLNKFSNKKEP